MLERMREITASDWIIGAIMIVMILAGTYMSYRPYKAASAPVTLSIMV